MKIISDLEAGLRTTTTTTPPPADPADAPLVPEYGAPFHPADGGRVRSRRAFVAIAITCAVLLVLASMASIWHRWHNLSLPTSYILLYGDETTANADVTVLMGRSKVAQVKLTEAEQYQKPVLVEPGLYQIEARMDGQLVVLHRFILPNNARGVMVPITLRPEGDDGARLPPGANAFRPGTRPASRPGG